ncbi:MAG: ABC transporter ATP-binding protein [Actinomycetota bacterium]
MLEVKDLHVRYGAIEALKGVSLTVEGGEIVTLIGGNGAGKTTTLKAISAVMRPAAGGVFFEGTGIDGLAPHEVVRRGICQAPEGRRIFPRLSVKENLEMGAYARRDAGGVASDFERVFALFPVLSQRLGQAGGTLSGGEQQMLAIGRALMAAPKLLLLDEPSMGLAPRLVDTIFEIIREINAQGTPILLVEQNAQMALATADRGYVLESGEIVLEGEASSLMGNDGVRKAYLGER